MASWPTTLPEPLVDAASYTPQDNAIRTQMAAGTAKVRRRFTAVPEDVSFTLRLSTAQVDVLDAFVIVTLKDVLPFTWKNFRKVGFPVCQYRFVRRPKYTAAPKGPDLWDAAIDLELLP